MSIIIIIIIIIILWKQSVDYIHGRKTEHFMTQTGHSNKWDHFDISATGQSDIHCKIKENLLIGDSKPALNENVDSEKLLIY